MLVNGTEAGHDLLSNMSWTFEDLIAYASRGTWVRAGDVIGSGTCGNGAASPNSGAGAVNGYRLHCGRVTWWR